MLTTVKGTYENGQVTLDEEVPVNRKTCVLVTVLDQPEGPAWLEKRPFGLAKGSIRLADDFDEPLDDLRDYM